MRIINVHPPPLLPKKKDSGLLQYFSGWKRFDEKNLEEDCNETGLNKVLSQDE